MAAVKEVLCSVGDEVYGIDIAYVKGIEKYVNISPVPNAPGYIEGIINLRGDVIPIYNLRYKFNLPKTEPTENTKLIISKSGEILIAFMVDMVTEIVELEKEAFHELPTVVKTEETAYIRSIAQVGGRLVVMLDLEAMLSGKESSHIKNMLEE